MKKKLFIITLILMAGILLANPGHGNHHRNDHHIQVRYKQHNGRKVIIVKPNIPRFVLRFDVDPHDRYYEYRQYQSRNTRSGRNYDRYDRNYNDRNKYARSYHNGNRRNYRYKDLEVVRRYDIEPLLGKLERYYERGLIDKKEYHYARQELREMVGKMYPDDYAEDYVEEVVEQIAELHRLHRRGMISSYEYEKYKN